MGQQTVTGVNYVFVNTKNGAVRVDEGEALPSGVSNAEIERLTGLNVFGEHPRVAREREIEAMIAMGLASRTGTPTGVIASEDDDDDLDGMAFGAFEPLAPIIDPAQFADVRADAVPDGSAPAETPSGD